MSLVPLNVSYYLKYIEDDLNYSSTAYTLDNGDYPIEIFYPYNALCKESYSSHREIIKAANKYCPFNIHASYHLLKRIYEYESNLTHRLHNLPKIVGPVTEYWILHDDFAENDMLDIIKVTYLQTEEIIDSNSIKCTLSNFNISELEATSLNEFINDPEMPKSMSQDENLDH